MHLTFLFVHKLEDYFLSSPQTNNKKELFKGESKKRTRIFFTISIAILSYEVMELTHYSFKKNVLECNLQNDKISYKKFKYNVFLKQFQIFNYFIT